MYAPSPRQRENYRLICKADDSSCMANIGQPHSSLQRLVQADYGLLGHARQRPLSDDKQPMNASAVADIFRGDPAKLTG